MSTIAESSARSEGLPPTGASVATPSSAGDGADRGPDDDGRRGVITRLRTLSWLRLGLAGQVCTFAAMVVPIALHQGTQMLVLVYTSAIASALVPAALLGYQFVHPVLRGPRMTAVSTRLALAGLIAVSLLLLPLTLVEDVLGLPAGTFPASAVLLLTMGLYGIALTQQVRAGNTREIGSMRLSYGVAALALTVAACLWSTSPLGLTLATATAYLVPAARTGLHGTRSGAPPAPLHGGHRRRLTRVYLARSVRPTVSSLANGWAFFLPGLMLPGLGVAAEPWAIVNRICGGFSTVMITIVAPPMEARMAAAVRARDRAEFNRSRRSALLTGGAVSTFAVLTGLVLAGAEYAGTVGSWLPTIAPASALTFGVLVLTLPINRVPNFVGRDTPRLVWDAARATLVTVALLTTDGGTRLVSIGAVLTVFGLALLPLTRWSSSPGPLVGERR